MSIVDLHTLITSQFFLILPKKSKENLSIIKTLITVIFNIFLNSENIIKNIFLKTVKIKDLCQIIKTS